MARGAVLETQPLAMQRLNYDKKQTRRYVRGA